MSAISSVVITSHTTSSAPHPHILYIVNVMLENGKEYKVLRRYSEFVILRNRLASSFPLPPTHWVSVALVPSTWVNDDLIKERKKGLEIFLTHLIHDMQLRNHVAVLSFLSADGNAPAKVPEMTSKASLAAVCPSNEPDDRRRFIAASYYPSWASSTNPPDKIDFSKFDILFYAFATPNDNSGINWEDGTQETLTKLISSARSSGRGTKIVLSIGGWSGSHWYSQAMSTENNRTKLVKAMSEVVNSLDLDGIDIDWEYPNDSGAGNPHAPTDAANFLAFLKLLRSTLGDSKIISAAVNQLPWLGENGKPLKDVSEYAKYITYVNIMNYDVFSSSEHPGPNAPLGDLCGSSSQPKASAQGAFAEWTHAGMSPSQLLLGLPLYGYVSKSTDKKLSTGLGSTKFPPCHGRNKKPIPEISAPLGDLSHLWGQQIPFNQMVETGALVRNDEGKYESANGYTSAWDDCSDTPFIYNTSRKTVVTYDDTYSFESKTKFARSSGMAGCFTWSLDQDDNMALHDVILRNLGRL